MRRVKLSYDESHKVVDGQLYKLCNRCGKWYLCTDEYFHKNSKSPDNLFPYCKKCNIKASNEYQYKPENKKRCSQSKRKYQLKPEVAVKEKNHKRKLREEGYYSDWRKNNKDKVKQYNEIRSNKKHTISKKEWGKCKEYFNNSCAYCGMTEGEHRKVFRQDLHKEHVDYEGSNNLSNCVPSCKHCNSSKRESELDNWYNKENPNFNQEKIDKILKWINEDYKLYKTK